MRISRFGYAVSISAAALLAACGGSQPPAGAPGAMPKTSAGVTHAGRGKSWMLPEAMSQDLFYVANTAHGPGTGTVTVYTYPRGKLVGDLKGFDRPNGLCVDKAGDVYVASFYGETVSEYAHGGAKPIKTLEVDGAANGCAIDPTTGDLAVTLNCDGPIGYCYPSGTVLIYKKAEGHPETIADIDSPEMFFCTYDKRGNLFTDGLGRGLAFAELPKGSETFRSIALVLPKGNGYPGGLEWAEGNLAVSASDGNAIYEYRIDGDRATRIHRTLLNGLLNDYGTNQFWIFGGSVVAPVLSTARYPDGLVEFFEFPAGGKPMKFITKSLDRPWAAAVSPATT